MPSFVIVVTQGVIGGWQLAALEEQGNSRLMCGQARALTHLLYNRQGPHRCLQCTPNPQAPHRKHVGLLTAVYRMGVRARTVRVICLPIMPRDALYRSDAACSVHHSALMLCRLCFPPQMERPGFQHALPPAAGILRWVGLRLLWAFSHFTADTHSMVCRPPCQAWP